MSDIDITGIDKAELLAALYNNARPLGMGFLHARDEPMSKAEAAELLAKHERNGRISFDYVHGRPLKVWFMGDVLSGARLYDRDQGQGECERIVAALRGSLTSSPATKEEP